MIIKVDMGGEEVLALTDAGNFYAWNRAHTVNVRETANGPDLDCFSFGDFSKNHETLESFKAAVERWEADRSE